MRNTFLKGICQTLILMLALLLITTVFLQLTFTELGKALESADETEPLLHELEAEDGLAPAEETEADQLESLTDMDDYPTSLRERITVKVLEDPSFSGVFYTCLFLLIALYLILDAWPLKDRDRRTRTWILVNAALYLGCGVPFMFAGYTDAAAAAMNILYSAILLVESAVKLRKNHRPHQVAARIVLLLLMLANLNLFLTVPMFVLLLIALRSVEQILRISFSQIRMDVLRRIIRKTYASEILLGLLLLMVAFSLLLSLLDPGISSFEDALWFCFATVTTIGYGDVASTTLLGRILSVILGVYGIIVVALITSIIVNFYNEMKTEGQ